MKNKIGMEVPAEIEKKARELGCHQGSKYVYKDGDYGKGFPIASIGGKKATPFRNMNNANDHKVHLGNGWVAFTSPSYSKGYIPDSISQNHNSPGKTAPGNEDQNKGAVQQIINVTIKDSIVQRSNLLNPCDIEGNCPGDFVVEDSLVQHAKAGTHLARESNLNKIFCPSCGAELMTGSKFCHLCGEKTEDKLQ